MVYEGEKNYIFVSYSHKDASKVLPIVSVLGEQGFRVWYDAGIEAGSEWPEYIEDHLKRASVVLAFMTPNAVESKNCRNEINYALSLDKDTLIVYLEDTILAKGMQLQLNSTQSLFRQNHLSSETFMRELLYARILQGCKESSEEEQVSLEYFERSKVCASQIANICSIGTNDENDLWPQGRYAQCINRDEFRVVFFHINLLKPFGFIGTINEKFRIYNSENQLIFDDSTTMDIEPNHDRISKGWILKGLDGTFVPSGEYRFVCSINDSKDFTYFFTVVSDAEMKPKSLLDKIKRIFK